MFIENYFGRKGRKSPLFLLLLLLSVTWSYGNQTQQNFINSCGDLHNISFPFQLQGNPSNNTCNVQFNNTLSCDEYNRTVIHIFSGKYYVQSINYDNQSFRLVDAGIQTNDTCSSFPLSSVYLSSLNINDLIDNTIFCFQPLASNVVFLSCENPVESPGYKNRTGCNNSTQGERFENGYYSYVVAGNQIMYNWDVPVSCSVEAMYMSSSQLISERGSDLSLLDFNRELGYGFELSWFIYGGICSNRTSCIWDYVDITYACRFHCCGDTYCHYEQYPSSQGSFWSNIRHALWYQISDSGSFTRIIAEAEIVVRLLLAPCVFGFLIYKFSRRHLSMYDNIEDFLQSQNHLAPIRYSYSEIKKMTNGFRDKLGEGGYGSVYKGKLRSGPLVAIKMLSKPKANGQEFINEVATIGRIHHVHVVELIGYCAEGSKRALVYDFMPNGSLEKHIFCPEGESSLSCQQMYDISLGVARGIGYLHHGCDMQILHFDIKPHNILLDENFTPKVSDFGLAKLYATDDSIVTMTAVRGTLGYMAPELFYKNIGGVSHKADIYSFGMLLMEMAGKRINWNSSAKSSEIFFPSWVYDQFTEGKNIQIGETTEEESEMVKKMMLVALWCIQTRPSDRPSMNKVVEMLEGSIELLHIPPKPFLYSQGILHAENSEVNKMLSGACLDSLTCDISGR